MPARKAKLKFDDYDVLIGLFHFWALKRHQITFDNRIFQNSLYFISKLPRYKRFCRDWQFQEEIGFKYCKSISDLVTNMHIASMIDIISTSRGIIYVIFSELHARWQNIEQEKFTKQDKILLEEMADRVAEKMNTLRQNQSK